MHLHHDFGFMKICTAKESASLVYPQCIVVVVALLARIMIGGASTAISTFVPYNFCLNDLAESLEVLEGHGIVPDLRDLADEESDIDFRSFQASFS